VLKQVKENKELADKIRDLEKRNILYWERLKEYEKVFKKMNEDTDMKDAKL
jgi:hypothetical protein